MNLCPKFTDPKERRVIQRSSTLIVEFLRRSLERETLESCEGDHQDGLFTRR